MSRIKIEKKIVKYRVQKPKPRSRRQSRRLRPAREAKRPQGDGGKVVWMHEKLERPEMLIGSTYKIKTPVSEHAMYLTINDIMLNEGTEHEHRRPFEIFINSKNLDHFQWIVALTRIISAVFRKGGDVAFLTEELKAVFDPRGGYWQPGGKFMPSIVAEIGYVVERHLQTIGLMQKPGLDDTQRLLIESKRKEWELRHKQQDAFAESSYPEGAQLCAQVQHGRRRHDGRLHDLPRPAAIRSAADAADIFLTRQPGPRPAAPETGAARDLPGGLRAAFFPPRCRDALIAHLPECRCLAKRVLALAKVRKCVPAPLALAAARPAARPNAPTTARRLRSDERAIVRADPVVSAGLPVQVRLRQVDGREIGLSASQVELPPASTSSCSSIAGWPRAARCAASPSEASSMPGGRYRLVADATARNCEAVAADRRLTGRGRAGRYNVSRHVSQVLDFDDSRDAADAAAARRFHGWPRRSRRDAAARSTASSCTRASAAWSSTAKARSSRATGFRSASCPSGRSSARATTARPRAATA